MRKKKAIPLPGQLWKEKVGHERVYILAVSRDGKYILNGLHHQCGEVAVEPKIPITFLLENYELDYF